MDKEQIKRALEKKLKELGAPQEDIDKALLDYDTLANDIDDVKALERFGEQLVENTAYKNNIAPDDGLEEYRKIFPEVWGTEPPSDKDIEDFLNEEIGNEFEDLNLSTPNDNDLLFASERRAELIEKINKIENDVIKKGLLKRYEDLDNYIFDDMNEVRKKELLRFTNNKVIEDMESFKDILNTPYRELQWPATEDIEDTFFDYVEPTPIEDEYWAEAEGWDRDAEGKPIDPSKNPEAESWSNFQKELNYEYGKLNKGLSIEEAVDDGWPPTDPYDTPPPGYVEQQTASPTDEFDEIIENEKRANWWRYDGSSPEHQDYMERYTTGDLTDEELADLRSQHEDFAKDVDDYDQKVADAGQQFGVKDNALWSNMVKAGARLLGAIDEEIIYSPLIMAQKGMKALNIPGAGLLGTGLSGVLAYESILFKGMVGMAVLAHGTEMLKGEVERAPENLELIKENTIPAMSNAILGLFGMGMPEQLTQSHQKDLKPKSEEYEASVAEQGENHKNMLYNQAYLYSRVSPSLRFYTDVLGPKTGMYDQIGVLKKVAGLGKNTGETRSYNQFGVND